MKFRWIVEEDGTRRLQYAESYRTFGDGIRHYEWQDVEEVPAANEYD